MVRKSKEVEVEEEGQKKEKKPLTKRQKQYIKTMPETLTLTVATADGTVLEEVLASPRGFASGAVGFYFRGVIADPADPRIKYTLGANMVMQGSKPKEPEFDQE